MNAPARIRPSRRYMIQQAVLNAAEKEWDWLGNPERNPQRLDHATHGTAVLPGWLEAAVCREFRALNERWAA